MIHNTAVLTLSEGWRKQSSALKICVAENKEKGFGNYFPKPNLVGVTGFEPAASTSQTSRATNCATPRSVKNIRFLVNFCKWSNLWSKHFVGVFLKRVMPEKVSIYKVVQRFGKLTAGKCLHAPKPSALPTALHPEIYSLLRTSRIISQLFLSVNTK